MSLPAEYILAPTNEKVLRQDLDMALKRISALESTLAEMQNVIEDYLTTPKIHQPRGRAPLTRAANAMLAFMGEHPDMRLSASAWARNGDGSFTSAPMNTLIDRGLAVLGEAHCCWISEKGLRYLESIKVT